MKKYKEKFRYLDARLKISFVVVCILSFLLVLCLDREWIFPEGFWKIAMIFLLVLFSWDLHICGFGNHTEG